jgi:hypothetical protein
MKKRHRMSPSDSSLRQLLVLGWRKGYAMNDLLMWGFLQLSLAIPVLALIIALATPDKSAWEIFTSPLFWLIELLSFIPLLVRLHRLASRIGCTRQMNVSDDGNPAPCLIDLGHEDCCKHIGPGGDKTSCPYWKPELIVD